MGRRRGKLHDCRICFELSAAGNHKCPYCHQAICQACWQGWLQARADTGYEYICPLAECRRKLTDKFRFSLEVNIIQPKPIKNQYYWSDLLVKNLRKLDNWFHLIKNEKKVLRTSFNCIMISTYTLITCIKLRIMYIKCQNYPLDIIDGIPGSLLLGYIITDGFFGKLAELIAYRFQMDSDTRTLISQKNYQTCPSCHILIEKNGGCPDMRCSQCFTNFRWK